jgi:hypothetical protein
MTAATWDLFPADVTLPDGQKLNGVRVILTDQGMAMVYDTLGQQVTQAFASAVHGAPSLKSPYAPRYDSESSIPTVNGVLTVTRGAGCGCGSVLKSANLATLGVSA